MLKILAIYRNFMSLIHEDGRDILTGLLNRKTFDLKINTIITGLKSHMPSRTDARSYLAIFDLDYFKQVNETHGHLIGDEVELF